MTPRGAVTARTDAPFVAALRGPMGLLVLVAVPMAVWASASPVRVSLPRAAVLVGSVLLAWAVTRLPRDARGHVPWWPVATVGVALALLPGLGPNERAGAVAPWAVAALVAFVGRLRVASPVLRSGRLVAQVVVALALVVVVLRTGSRGGSLAMVVGLAVAALLMPATRRVRMRVVAAMMVGGLGLLAITLVLPTPGGNVVEAILFGGSPQGWGWDVILSGRPRIWDRALDMAADGGVTGMGLGMFGTVVRGVYALPLGNGLLEDAHSLPLQVLLDLGVIGLLAWGLIVGRTARQAWCQVRDSSSEDGTRWRAVALLGAVGATAVFNLADAVAPGTLAGAGQWLLVGMVFAHAGTRSTERDTDPGPGTDTATATDGVRTPRRRVWIVRAAALLVALALIHPSLRRAVFGTLRLDHAARNAVRAVLDDDRPALRAAHAALAPIARATCRAHWLEGRVLDALGEARRDEAWLALVACAPTRTALVATAAPDDRDLARAVVAVRPEQAAAHLWRARSLGRRPVGETRSMAIRAYRRGLALDPRDGYAWRQLGDLLVTHAPRQALAAYAGSCRHGDPGANGCFLAGVTAEHVGDVDAARAYYAASRWPPARARGAALARDHP